ncbi:hypothetical protein HanRHA438_Chr06g0273471 [Helianthus annuus]|uniref:Uncharacterized protein n=1 Tax=Helianthus annuus TaxID=4232 RepID=A0A9K3ITQ8_HELAN|nr:hypothetical protein HanXRQr2_Chr06g0264201 [Helianthus annuus]KAJ0560906.1 hypothetical protein HanHA300_Chr06g0216741 [Helianthus annuus]KAJ0567377.1 hypothetical protein HanIR_Chr06g0284131 [Helianthus annuus]KAJ0573945.1 hypothetical protein HanHA89_Chr06g0232541 [Helianthus annuus]KAJ0741171.1 hypothetical protein HanOQP8_Chr06g0225021 [Helianthus annuus]
MGSDYRLGLVKRKYLFSQGCFFYIYFNLSQQFFYYYLILYLTMILCTINIKSQSIHSWESRVHLKFFYPPSPIKIELLKPLVVS